MIDQAKTTDLPEILDLQREAFFDIAKLMDNYELPPLFQSVEELHKEFLQGIILKYFSKDGKIIGSVRGYIDDSNICHIGKLIVSPTQQNQGIGKALMYEIETYFPTCERYTLFTSDETPNTIHLYEKIGYHIVTEQVMQGLNMYLMEKHRK